MWEGRRRLQLTCKTSLGTDIGKMPPREPSGLSRACGEITTTAIILIWDWASFHKPLGRHPSKLREASQVRERLRRRHFTANCRAARVSCGPSTAQLGRPLTGFQDFSADNE